MHRPVPSRSRRPVRTLGALAALAVLASTFTGIASAGATDRTVVRHATTPKGTVTLLTYDSFAVSDDVLAAFTKRTGLEVEILRNGDAGQIVNQAILTKDRPVADAIFGVDSAFLGRALDAGILARYRPADLDTTPESFRAGTQGRATPIDSGDVCVNVDRSWFAKRRIPVPTTFADLVKPRYRGLLVVEDPSTSSPGLIFLLATVAEFGPDGWQRWWRQLRANDALVVDGWDQAYNDEFTAGGGGGAHPLVVSYATSPVAAVVYSDPPVDSSPVGTMTATCFRDVEYAGVLTNAANPGAARKLVDFLLSEPFQADLPLQLFVRPAREGTPLPKVFTEHDDTPEEALSLPARTIDRNRDAWIREWTGIVLR